MLARAPAASPVVSRAGFRDQRLPKLREGQGLGVTSRSGVRELPELTGTRDLRAYLAVLWRWKWLFLLFVVAVPVAAFLIERSQPASYRSSALVGINEATVNSSLLSGRCWKLFDDECDSDCAAGDD